MVDASANFTWERLKIVPPGRICRQTAAGELLEGNWGVQKMAGSSVAITGCNAGERHPASGVAGLPAYHSTPENSISTGGSAPFDAFGEALATPTWQNALLPRDASPAGKAGDGAARSKRAAERAQGGPYVHTPIGTSSPQVFHGSTVEWEDNCRKKKKGKQIVRVADSLFKCGRTEQARALIGCGYWFRRENFPCGTYKLFPFPCDSPLCPDCAARRALPLQRKIMGHLSGSKYRYWLLTVTVRNWPTLTKEALRRYVRDFARLRESELWTSQVRGGVYSIEATFNRTADNWHPHLHVLIETKGRIPMDWIFRLRVAWKEITGSHVLNLEPIYGLDKKGEKKRKVNMRAVKELVKYATKSADFADYPERVDEFLTAFENIRRVQSFGSFVGFDKADEEVKEKRKDELVGCNCGACTWRCGTPAGLYHLSQTILRPDGVRQLRLFDSGTDPPFDREMYLEIVKKWDEEYNKFGRVALEANSRSEAVARLF